jgi:hypothetical protein
VVSTNFFFFIPFRDLKRAKGKERMNEKTKRKGKKERNKRLWKDRLNERMNEWIKE